MEKKVLLARCTDKLFGGIDLKWWKVIAFAVATAFLTSIFLIIPIFEKTSFYMMGVYFEAWIFFAVIIMSNCKKPLESALKTFVFFLISQPLIYLFQVPFSSMGWQLFGYYYNWFIWTLITFPMAFVGWYIRKKNWISFLILLPVIAFLTLIYVGAFSFTFKHFPYRLITALFCLAQVVLYLYAFTPKLWMRLTGLFVPLAAILFLTFCTSQVNMMSTQFLPDEPVLTEAAVASTDNTDIATVTVAETGKDSMIRVQGNQYGTTDFTIKDGKNEYRYTLEIYEDNEGMDQIRITPVE